MRWRGQVYMFSPIPPGSTIWRCHETQYVGPLVILSEYGIHEVFTPFSFLPLTWYQSHLGLGFLHVCRLSSIVSSLAWNPRASATPTHSFSGLPRSRQLHPQPLVAYVAPRAPSRPSGAHSSAHIGTLIGF